MKQGKLKTISVIFFTLILAMLGTMALTLQSQTPVDDYYDIDGVEIPVTCAFTPSSGTNITSVALYTNQAGSWLLNQTNTVDPSTTGAQVSSSFTINGNGNESISDGTNLLWGCLATQNDSTTLATTNRTINIEYPPTMTLNLPADSSWSSSRKVDINFTVGSHYQSLTSNAFSCQIYTNESGSWLAETGALNIDNNTHFIQEVTLLDKSAIKWGLRCYEGTDANILNTSVNRTINIDATDPTLSVSTEDATEASVSIAFTPTDQNLDTVRVFANFTGTYHQNYTNNSADNNLASGVEVTLVPAGTVSDGHYIYNVTVNDSAGNEVVSSTYTYDVDTTAPTITLTGNSSVEGYCDQRSITFTTDESANYTFTYDTDTVPNDGTQVDENSFDTSHAATIDFDSNVETQYYFNISACDSSGNCGIVAGAKSFEAPQSICTGWSQLAVYDTSINMSELQNQSGAELVYVWNATSQAWITFTAGLTTNEEQLLGSQTGLNVVHLFEETNSTWFRTKSNSGYYHYNVTGTSNFIRVPTDYTLGNLTESFMNGTIQFPSGTPTGTPLIFNITAFAAYNNTAHDYVNHVFNFSWANATEVKPCIGSGTKDTCMETVWVGSDFNVSWNGTAVFNNWTR